MKIFKNFFNSIKPAVARFPALYLFSAVAAVFSTLLTNAWNIYSATDIKYESAEYKLIQEKREAFEAMTGGFLKAALLVTVFSFFAGILCPWLVKKFNINKKKLFALGGQILCLPLFVLFYFVFKGASVYANLVYGGISLALLFCSIYLLMFEQEEGMVAPNLIVSGMISGISAGCVCAGLFIIRFAISTLLFDFGDIADNIVNAAIVSFSWLFCCTGIFAAYATKPKEEIACPKAFKVIFMFILFPLYLVLLLVLYAYLAKSLFTLTLPNGKINWFVSFASAFYLIFYFSIRQFENKAAKLFCRWGALLLIPLIITQCVAFGIRINAYGYTGARYASLLYIIFSVLCVALSFVQKGKWMSLAFPLFALISLFATITPLNLVDVPYKNQVAIIQKVYKEAGLLNADGTVDAKAANEKLERKQKAKVVSAYDQIKLSEANVKKPLWLLKSGEGYDFKKSFGFVYSNNYDKEVEGKYYEYKFEMDNKLAFDVSQYSSLYKISYCDDSDDKVVIKWGDEQKTDLTQETLSLLKEVPEEEYNSYKDDEKASEKPLVLKTENGWTIVATYVYAKQRILDDGEKNFWSVDINGFVVK